MAEHKNIYAALLAAQEEMGPVLKNSTNPAFHSKYADLGSVIETIEQPLRNNGLVFFQPLSMTADGQPTVRTVIVHASTGEKVESEAPLVCKDPSNPQAVGGAITYFRRYSLLSLLGLAPEDDDGTAASQAPRERTQAPRENPAPPRTNPPQSAQSTQLHTPIDGTAPDPGVVSWTVFWTMAKELGVRSMDEFVELTGAKIPDNPQHALNRLRKVLRERDAALAGAPS